MTAGGRLPRWWLGWPGRRRFDHVREIARLDPSLPTDRDRIVTLTARHEFPWDFDQGTAIAFLRDYGVPGISRLLDRTRQFQDDGVKRYDDTLIFQEEAAFEGIDSPRARVAADRLNRIHGHYRIPDHQFRYVLATTLVGPVRWIGRYGWRDLHPHEIEALTRVTTRFGELMEIPDLPHDYAGYHALLTAYEAEHFAFDPANRRVTEATLRIARATVPWWQRAAVRRVTVALMDEPLRTALGMPAQPRWLVAGVDLVLRLRARLLRWAPPRAAAYQRRHPSYPGGYLLSQIGPTKMLDTLNRLEEETHA